MDNRNLTRIQIILNIYDPSSRNKSLKCCRKITSIMHLPVRPSLRRSQNVFLKFKYIIVYTSNISDQQATNISSTKFNLSVNIC